jgi:hypothetical protein
LKGGTQLLDMNQILIGSGVIFFLGWLIPSPLSWSARRKLQAEYRLLQEHLNTKMKIEAKGMSLLGQEKEHLKQMNENLRITNQTLQNKPGRFAQNFACYTSTTKQLTSCSREPMGSHLLGKPCWQKSKRK